MTLEKGVKITSPDVSFPKENTIKLRNRQDTIEAEVLLWRALCDCGHALKHYLSPDCIMVFPDGEVYTMESEPSINDALDDFLPWTTFRIEGEPAFVEIDMMATTIAYRVSLSRMAEGEATERVDAMASSVWRQDAGGDWKLCMHHLSYQ